MVGDGSYMMMNSELATSVMLGLKLIVVVLDNRGYGCINRLQQATGGAAVQQPARRPPATSSPAGDRLRRPRRSMGATRREGRRRSPSSRRRWPRARAADRTYVIVIDTDPTPTTEAGGAWWDVAVPEVSERAEVRGGAGGLREGP